MSPTSELENYESPRSIEPLSQRELMLDLGVFFWLLISLQALLAGSLVEDAMSSAAWTARFVIAGFGLFMAVSLLTWIRHQDDKRTFQIVNSSIVLLAVALLILSTYGPASVATMYVGYVGIAIFAGQFMRFGELCGQIAFLTVLSALGLTLHSGDIDAPHVVARVVALVPIMWTVGFSVYALRQDRARALIEVETYAFSDPLTGLVNLRALRRRAQGLLSSRNERINRPAAVLVIDIDGFRGANVLRGHLEGDRLLIAIAEKIRMVDGDHRTVGRTGSDEFMVLIENADERELDTTAELYRQAVIDAGTSAGYLGATLDASVGSAISPRDGGTFDELVDAADRRMYAVKAEHELKPQQPNSVDFVGNALSESSPPAKFPRTPVAPRASLSDRLAWRTKPVQVRYVTVAWTLSTLFIALALTVPDADVSNTGAVITILSFSMLMTIVRYFLPPSTKTWQQIIDVLVAYAAIALMMYWTGGAGSPAWPAALLVIIYVGWFMPLRWILPLTTLAALTILSPMLYQDFLDLPIVEQAATLGGLAIGTALAAIIFYNHFYLVRAQEMSARLESIDPRTGLHNRREFDRTLSREIDFLGYADIDALAIVMLDLGDFKNVSAQHGRAAADEVLRAVANALESASRSEDCVARLGGDEFAIVLPGVTADMARTLAQRFVRTVTERLETEPLARGAKIIPSAGFALYGMHGRTSAELVAAADVALTTAKTSGRDDERVSSFVVSL